jgi:hypothetical protein
MLRPRPDLEDIDRELEQLGAPREDVAELVAKYAGLGRSMPPFDKMMAMLSEPDPAAATQPRDDASNEASDDDHDDFELLVDDEDMDSVEEDDELESVA